MASRRIYQTLENRNNPEDIEREGPFICHHATAWLGKGYYFWESFIENAHWWGESCYAYPNGYVVCEASYDFDENLCFNLVDNPKHFQMLRDTINLMKKQGLYEIGKTTIARIINYLKDDIQVFKFYASRTNGLNSRSKNSPYSEIALFNKGSNQYLDLVPTIQICFYKRGVLNLRDYKIVYPDEFVDGYAV